MFRPIRRKKKEISTEAAKQLLHDARYGFLAVNGDDGYPYAVPVNYIYDEQAQRIYFHGSRAGHKADSLKRCGKVCFTVCGSEIIQDEAWAPYVKSAVVFGQCRALESTPETLTTLRQLAMKYYPDERLVDEEIASAGKAVQMYEIEIEHLSGKEVQER